ncbi:mRNA splicing protein prp18 [Chytriomyces hyalinus]|nr:mRNA splicing protein prp18 [Chytriomyces hyalinus]
MDILKAEIERKRKEASGGSAGNGRNKYVRRGDAASATQAASNLTAQTAPTTAAAAAPAAGAGAAGAAAGVRDSGNDAAEDEGARRIPEADLVARFRARGVPIRLFAETYAMRIVRLKALESTEERSEGQQNDFRALLAKADAGIERDLLEKQAEGLGNRDETKRREMEALLEKIDTTTIGKKLHDSDPEKNRYLIGAYFKKILLIWERTLNERPDEEKRSTQGRLALATRAQTAEYLKPLFAQLKRGTIEADVVARVTEICQFMQEREYLKANDSYLRLSIGNAPWPIGVTMVGIHERSGREKISSSHVAHGLNDETQRKWIQSIKRMMSFAQSIWPPDDLGKAVG